MRRQLLKYLTCPACGDRLTLDTYRTHPQTDIISDGLLSSVCGRWFPVVRGVPRMFTAPLVEEYVLLKQREFLTTWYDRLPENVYQAWSTVLRSTSPRDLKKATAESFGFEWKRFHKMFDSYRQNFLNYIEPYTATDLIGRVILDAGCGVGRHTYWAAKFGAQDVIGYDLSDAVEPAEENCRDLSNAHIVQGDIYAMPFAQPFDFSMSIGVLHHLPDPEAGFRSIVDHTKAGGTVLIWVYGRVANNAAVYAYEPIRVVTRRIPKPILVLLCYPFAGVVEACNQLGNLFDRMPGAQQLNRFIPFQYYRQFPFEVKLNDAFDVLATPKSRYYRIEQIRAWFDRAKLPDPDLRYLRKKSIIASARIPA